MGMFDHLPIVNPPQQPAAEATSPEEDVVTSTMRGIGQGATFGQAPNIGGAVNYALHGGAEGSFDEGYNRSAEASQHSQEQHPDAYSVGNVVGGAATSMVPGMYAARTPALVNQAIRYGLNAMGWGKGVKAIDAVIEHGPKLAEVLRKAPASSAAATAETAGIGPNLAQALRAGKFRTEGAPKGRAPGPAPNARMRSLSPEMQAKSDAYQAFLRRHSLNQ